MLLFLKITRHKLPRPTEVPHTWGHLHFWGQFCTSSCSPSYKSSALQQHSS